MNSLKYTQKLIDLRINYLQNNKLECDRDYKSMANLPILSLDELLNKELTLSYYLDYLSILNLQYYVIFYLTARGEYNIFPINPMSLEFIRTKISLLFWIEWKATVARYSIELQSTKQKSEREDVIKLLREKASNIYKEVI